MNAANSRLMKCIERLSWARLLEVTPVNNIKDIDLGVIPENLADRHFETLKSFYAYSTKMTAITLSL